MMAVAQLPKRTLEERPLQSMNCTMRNGDQRKTVAQCGISTM
jgi:hypothetical protein